MKKLIGIILVLLSLALISIVILRIWDIEIVSLNTIIKSSATLVVLGVALVVLIILYGALLRNNDRSYDSKSGNRAHPKL